MRKAWIFDLDGTLTVPMHNFAELKRALGLPRDRDILAGIAVQPEAKRAALHQAVKDWEDDHIKRAKPAEGARALLEALGRRPKGILTRNTRETAFRTLDAIGLRSFFDDESVLGRDCAAPKPAPDGILKLLDLWDEPARDAVMVGDYVHDLQAGEAAGTLTIWLDPDDRRIYRKHADLTVRDLGGLLAYSGL